MHTITMEKQVKKTSLETESTVKHGQLCEPLTAKVRTQDKNINEVNKTGSLTTPTNQTQALFK